MCAPLAFSRTVSRNIGQIGKTLKTGGGEHDKDILSAIRSKLI